MDDLADFKFWLRQLECPESYSSDYVVNRLQKDVLGLIWEDIPKVIKPNSEVSEIRKNILLYKLKYEPKDPLIQSVRNTVHLREESKKLDAKIKNAEEKWKQQEFLCRQKIHLLEKKKAERQTSEIKKEILKIKYEQMQTQINNCAKMREICDHLMPPTVEEVSQSTISECLSLVSNYSNGPDKRKTWDRIAELLNPVKIPVLWNALLVARSHCTDFLIHLDIEEHDDRSNKTKSNVDAGIAKICSEHLDNVAMRYIYNGRMKNSEETVMKYVQKIDQIIEKSRSELTDWLPLVLEVRKLEVLQNELQKECERLEEQLPVDSLIVDNVLEQLTAEIKAMDSKTDDCVQEIKRALNRLKSSSIVITKMRESLSFELEKLHVLQTNEENNWRNIDLSTELVVFNNEIDINALRKIMLKGGSGTYRHLRTCFNQATHVVNIQNRNGNVSNLPILHAPIYYLVDLFKTFVANTTLHKLIYTEDTDVQDVCLELPEVMTEVVNARGVLQLLRLADVTCKKTLQQSEEFERILKTWSNQTMREVVSKVFSDKTEYGATFDEWQKRFTMIVYVLQKSNINAV